MNAEKRRDRRLYECLKNRKKPGENYAKCHNCIIFMHQRAMTCGYTYRKMDNRKNNPPKQHRRLRI